jgi:retinol dehydrogenase 12
MATYLVKHYTQDGILTFSLNPGAIRSELQRHMASFFKSILGWFLFPPWQGAITQLFAGTSPTLTQKDSGKYFIPWAREARPRDGSQDPVLAEKLWDYLEKETAGKY